MHAINRLKRDHAIFRLKLNVLESALRRGPEAWFVLREACFSLAKQLDDHIQREERVRRALELLVSKDQSPICLVDHMAESRQVVFVNQFFVKNPNALLGRIEPTITLFITALRGRMDEQESSVFPMTEETLVLSKMNQRTVNPPWALHETMTVGEVLTRYPAVGPMLECLFINKTFERYDCLDEVAWRHGMESHDLLARLEEELTQGLAEDQKASGIPGTEFGGDTQEQRSSVAVSA